MIYGARPRSRLVANFSFTVMHWKSLINKDDLQPGELWFKRQYYITDSLTELGSKSRQWNRNVYKDMMDEQQVFRKLPQRIVYLFASSDKTTVGVSLQGAASCSNADLICTGSTTPKKENDGNILYSVACGDDAYIGPEMYFFAPKRDSKKDPVRLHRCRNQDKGVFPIFHFIGFFEKGSCDSISKAKYDPLFCKSTVSMFCFLYVLKLCPW
jgi:hypothetical protein